MKDTTIIKSPLFYLKKILKFTGIFILSFILFVVGYLGLAWCLSKIEVDKEPVAASDVAIHIKTNGVHTDIVVPVKTDLIDWSREIKISNTRLKDTAMKYLAMGWGDKGFYLETPEWSDLKFSVAFKAVFGLSTTAIHATFYDSLPENETCKKILISKTQYARLIDYINRSLQKDAAGHVIHIKTNANYSEADAFYEAYGSYSLFHTCNTWANGCLKYCGQKACLWTPFDSGIFEKYK